MKVILIVLWLLLDCAMTHAQDAPFAFHSPWGYDGTNQPNLDVQTRNYLVLDHVWDAYIQARKEISNPFPQAHPSGYNRDQTDHWMEIARYSNLLETMTELRAFITQNKGYADEIQQTEVVRVDKALRSLNLHYYQGSRKAMGIFCDETGLDKIRQSLAPVLCKEDGTLRPIPSMQLGIHHFRVK